MPLLLRSTLVAGLLAATGASVMRAHDGPAPASILSVGPRTAPVAAAATPSRVQSCRVRHSITSRSAGRYTAVLTITNTGRSAVQGWNLRWTYPGASAQSMPRLGDGWNASVTSDAAGGQAIDVELSHVIPPAGKTMIAFMGTASGAAPAPAGFTLNGVTCR